LPLAQICYGKLLIQVPNSTADEVVLRAGHRPIRIVPLSDNVAEAIDAYGGGFRVDENDRTALERLLQSLLRPTFDFAAHSRAALNAARSRYTESVAVEAAQPQPHEMSSFCVSTGETLCGLRDLGSLGSGFA